MTIWDILVGASFIAPISTAFEAAKRAGLGWGGYAVSMIIGLVVGLVFATLLRIGHTRTFKNLESWSSARLNLALIIALLIESAWIFFSGFVGWSSVAAISHSPR